MIIEVINFKGVSYQNISKYFSRSWFSVGDGYEKSFSGRVKSL